jgi:hypothetical protein
VSTSRNTRPSYYPDITRVSPKYQGNITQILNEKWKPYLVNFHAWELGLEGSLELDAERRCGCQDGLQFELAGVEGQVGFHELEKNRGDNGGEGDTVLVQYGEEVLQVVSENMQQDEYIVMTWLWRKLGGM